MVTIDEYSRMVTAIHAAATTPEHWIEAMTIIREALNSTSSGMIIADGCSRSIKSASLPPDAMQAYSDYYRNVDYVLDAVERGPVGLVRGGTALTALNARSEFNVDWMAPHKMDDGLFVRLTDGDLPTCFLVAAPAGGDEFATPDRVKLVSALIPHLQQALHTQKYISDLAVRASDAAEAVDGMRHAVFVVGPGAVIVHLNSAAEKLLASRNGPNVRAGSLCVAPSAAHAELRRSVGAALGLSSANAKTGNSFLCQRLSAGRPYVVHVTPFTARDHGPPRALVVVIDPNDDPAPSAELLRRLFGLTTAEAAVAQLVAGGHGLKPIADELALSVATVKTHLQRIFAKTDTHRQAELVRLLLALRP
ncbi:MULTISPECIES: helix-turn-helix transcriptional regulator [unclassified Mycobacterium]|uniref:helix-turn-helix transcriptional regulator n=1 Tax=unclassified Mycobacterium TaxID=2642494 RepID=UPI0029C611CB|nr:MULTISPECIES: helix-turn-helix transcriptional regulator [unclassified Mycobacterium]